MLNVEEFKQRALSNKVTFSSCRTSKERGVLRRLIQDQIENILSEEFLKDTYLPGDIIELDIIDNKIEIIQDSKVESNRDA